jgi:hypothetical protein
MCSNIDNQGLISELFNISNYTLRRFLTIDTSINDIIMNPLTEGKKRPACT